MKKYFFVALSFFNVQAFSQCPNPFIFNESKWEGIAIDIPLERKSELIDAERWPRLHLSEKEYYDQFFPVFINSDTLIDFIYEGFSGGESNIVEILINQGTGLNSLKQKMGQILNISRISPDYGYIINFEEYGCCDDPNNFVQAWIVTESFGAATISATHEIHYLNLTEIPECFSLNIKFEVQNTPYILRATPEINDSEAIHNFERGNIVAEYGKEDRGIALASRTDETGRIWWFVVMEKSNHSALFHNYAIFRSQKWAGWMSSKFLKAY